MNKQHAQSEDASDRQERHKEHPIQHHGNKNPLLLANIVLLFSHAFAVVIHRSNLMNRNRIVIKEMYIGGNISKEV